MKTYSLRRASLAALALPLVLALLATVLLTLWLADRAIGQMRDEQLRQEAGFLLLLSRHEAMEGEQLGVIETGDSRNLRAVLEPGSYFRIWSNDVVMTQSPPPAALPAGPPPTGFSHRTLAGGVYRTFALSARQDGVRIVIEIAEPIAARRALTRQVVASLALPLLLAIIAVTLVAQRQLGAAFKPMLDVSAMLDQRAPDDLSPLKGARVPLEIMPLIRAFNAMLDRLAQVLAREREFADNAAHELRTPLAVLKARAQIVARSSDPDRQREDVEKLVRATDRTAAVIDQLLEMNRIDTAAAPEPTPISRIAEAVGRELVPAALERRLEISADIQPGLWVMAQSDSLAMLLRNLLQNAINYTPIGGRVALLLHARADGTVEMRVQDSGPGIPEAMLDQVFDRFQRLGRSEPGSGLGLAIARRIADSFGARITLANRAEGGLDALVVLQPAMPAQGQAG